MYVRNCLHAGDYLVTVPLGIPITVQYDVDGNIEKVFQGYDESATDVSDSLLDLFIHSNTCPLHVATSGGTVWVQGVLYTSKPYRNSGKLPDVVVTDMIQDFCNDPSKFNFFAGHLKSVTDVLIGSMANRQWLSMSNFHTLPGYLISADMDQSAFDSMVDTDRFPFQYPYIMNYFIYRGSDFLIVDAPIYQYRCVDVVDVLKHNGEICAVVSCDHPGMNIEVSYQQIKQHEVQQDSYLLLELTDSATLLYADNSNVKHPKDFSKHSCPICHKMLTVYSDQDLFCDDVHCLSRKYLSLQNFCRILNLPTISFSEYLKCIQSGELTDIMDIIDIYQKDIQATISTVLKAFISPLEVPSASVIDRFVQKCNNNVDTVLYYMDNSSRISTEFGMNDVNSLKLIRWFQDRQNCEDIARFLYHPNVQISGCDKKFDGPPIFRNKVITVTGTFRHGDLSDICAIFQSYSAVVTSELLDSTNCVVVGDIPEDVNGSIVKKAHKRGIPIFYERNFFDTYNIDEDLKN